MTWAFRATGTIASAASGSITPGAPTTVSGDWMFLAAGEYWGSNTPPDLTASGWAQISSSASGITGAAIYAKKATSTSETMPAINYGSTTYQYAVCSSFSGGPTGALSFNNSNRGQNLTQNMTSGALTPPQNNSLVLSLNQRNKTSTSNGATISNWLSFIQAASAMPNGTSVGWTFQYWIQTTATAISLGLANSTNIADSAVQTTQGYILSVAPGSGAATGENGALMLMGVG